MVAEYVKRMHHKNLVQDVWFWRDAAGHEVDMITQDGQTLNLVEFKSTQTVMSDLFKGLKYFEEHSQNEHLTKTLVYAGSEFQKRSMADVLPWMEFGK